MLNAPIGYFKYWLKANSADVLFTELKNNIPWQEESLFMFGKNIKVPRKICWIADQDLIYRYSGLIHLPQAWIPALSTLREQVNKFLNNAEFNSVLCNYYQDGRDYMGWHQDDEPELGIDPMIASITLGVSRRFSLRHKQTKQRVDINLEHGSLLIMLPGCQREWEHCLPKSLKCSAARINLTFRKIIKNK